ncbi:hypothetical protein [Paracoccus sp. (in: a-proteobacteria)]|uniref:hypothetical protein n=1 Tax=Paracoccus sp. TaxID=267 RepID=UPI0028AE78E4|nr:hypothetical protein [Paracoccus sp. (in: a-proteobacteria)]
MQDMDHGAFLDPLNRDALRPMDIAAMCEGKEAFASPKLAHIAAKRRKGGPREVYHCRACNQWHVGTPMPKRPKPERKMLRPRNGVRNVVVRGRE